MKISGCLILLHVVVVDARLSPDDFPPMNLPPTIDFSDFSPGQRVPMLSPAVTVQAYKRAGKRGPLAVATAMIFDSSNPTGGDIDLGTPHRFFGGPGVGRGGHPNKSLFANRLAHGNVLIISTDANAAEPNDHKYGGQFIFTFDPPIPVKSIGILDNDSTYAWGLGHGALTFRLCISEGSTIEATFIDQSSILIDNGKHRNNSFDRVYLAKEAPVAQLIVTLMGSGAITDMQFGPLIECPLMPPSPPFTIPDLPAFPRLGYVRNCASDSYFCGLSPEDTEADESLAGCAIATEGTLNPLPYPDCLAEILTPMCDNLAPMDSYIVGVCNDETSECMCCEIVDGPFGEDVPIQPNWFSCIPL